ncbi:hypothetical protein BwSH20_15640 [Bradyrhizobium ottawaense]|nr:hypothetical protein SG09_38940 [Bradyrhizobium ottawaense]GMO15768.1 hypothetical protein BwSF21_05640 [Bradyrhizobium ottawaense]GMO15982.1 hypothetical protein BwSF12_00500 [Bradyrhizobium ottawaense]GMO61444.1 hypothetical protein BwSG10_09130 [Bradyrhizobium ottawaense]GMO81263.1 hypothetical protein BwSF19_33650 [Bradyrhizobium ottawaense]
MADDERHLLGGAERGGDDQIALTLTVLVVGDDHELTPGKGLQDFLNAIGHVPISIGYAGRLSRT